MILALYIARWLLVLLFIIVIRSTYAQSSDSLQTIVKVNSIKDSLKPKRNILLKSSIALGYAGAGILCYNYFDTYIKYESQRNKNKFYTGTANIVRNFGEGTYNWIACGSTAGFAYLTGNIKLQKTSVIWAGSLFANELIAGKLKTYFQRHRPNTGDAFNTFDWSNGGNNNRSLPSFHTSTAFATATVFATMYKDTKWVPPVAYSLATLVGLSRIYDNAHWASDVMAGAAIGFLSAKLAVGVYRLGEKKMILIIPQIGQKHSSLSLTYKF